MSEPEAPEAGQDKTQEFKGASFRLNPDESGIEFAIMEFAEAAEDDDGNAMHSTAALLRLALAIVHPEDRKRFRNVCRSKGAGFDDLMGFLGLKVEEQAERPTERPSDSSDGPEGTEPKSASSSDVKGSPIRGLELVKARPDLAVFLDQAAAAAAG